MRETTRFLTWVRDQLAIAGATVMGCLEEKLRDALRRDGRQCLENLLNDPAVKVADDHSRHSRKARRRSRRRARGMGGVGRPAQLRRTVRGTHGPHERQAVPAL